MENGEAERERERGGREVERKIESYLDFM